MVYLTELGAFYSNIGYILPVEQQFW